MLSRTRQLREDEAYRRTYGVWATMKDRCRNPQAKDYPNYGGRGIDYDSTWESFDKFLADMGLAPEGLTLDRRDNAAGYHKDNCRWATRYTQVHNSRTRRDNTSGLRGVSYATRDRNWVTYLDGKCLYRGKDFFEACCVRRSAEVHIWRP
jgi:hypothetical protein